MINPRHEDHITGLELELVELVEQRERARAQHRAADAGRLDHQIDLLHQELAEAADDLTAADARRPRVQLPEARSA